MKGHKDYITSMSWEPMHSRAKPKFMASSSKDCTIKVWNVHNFSMHFSLSGHQNAVTKVRKGKVWLNRVERI